MMTNDMLAFCRICGDTTHTLHVAKGYTLLRCDTCDFVQVQEEPTTAQLDKIYQAVYFGHSKYRDEKTLLIENTRRVELVLRHMDKGKQSRILEVGCGSGFFVHEIKQNFDVYGFDLSDAGIKLAKERNPDIADQLWAGRLEDLNLYQQKFDAICMWDVIEHIWDPLTTSSQLLSYLNPGGKIFISTPNIGSPIARFMGKYWHFMTPPEHLSFFSRSSMEYLFQDHHGAEIIEWKTLGKKVNIGFLLYKIKRVLPLFPSFLLKVFDNTRLSSLSMYVPTSDIQYVVIRKD